MNSLTELNNYNNSTNFTYTDNRYARVIFDRATPNNQTIVVNEGSTFSLPVGIEMTDIVNFASSVPSLKVDISSVYADGVRVDWPTVPTSSTVTHPSTDPSTGTTTDGIYRISGFQSVSEWNTIKAPNIELPTNLPNAFFGNFTITVTIDYYDANDGAQQLQYTVAVSVLDVQIMTTPLSTVYDTSTTTDVDNAPQIQSFAVYSGATWTLTATPATTTSIDNFSINPDPGGGLFTFNSGTKGFTLTGSRTDVNDALANRLRITSTAVESDFVLYYSLSNSVDSTTDTKTQTFRNSSVEFLSNPSDFYYTEDTSTSLTGNPVVNDLDNDGSGTYTVTVTPASTDDVFTMSTAGTGGTTNFNTSTRVLTLTGTRTQVNSHLNALTIQPEEDVDYLFQLTYSVTTPSADTASKAQSLLAGSNDNEISNMNVTRSYNSNQANLIFSSDTPQITDFDTTGSDTYTIYLSSSLGDFGHTGTTFATNYSYSGTRAQVNTVLGQIQFYPTANVSSNGTIDFELHKNGNTSVTHTISITGNVGPGYSNARTIEFLTTQTYTPNVDDVKYAEVKEYTLVGGGGGGSAGGGGGGQVITSSTPFSLSNTTYTITVGSGGSAGNSDISTSGGSNGSNGGNTTAFSYTALGGGGGGVITNAAPLSGGVGGYSYAPNGTQYTGGNPSIIDNGSSGSNIRYVYMGGGGAGSGGTTTIYTDSRSTINAPTLYANVNFGRDGGIGVSALGSTDSAANVSFNANFSFGFGGGGGRWFEGTGGGGGAGGYREPTVPTIYSSGASRHYDPNDGIPNSGFAAGAAQDTPRTSAVAGGGGGGGAVFQNSAFPPTAGGDGIVVIRLGAK